jgi:hypothetical protein
MVAEGQAFVVKRPGLSVDTTVVAGGGEGRGIYSWRDVVYSVIGDKLYKTSSSIQTLLTTTGQVSISELDTGTKYMLVQDGRELYQIATDDSVVSVRGFAESTSLVNSTYRWTASGSGTSEYYLELAGGGDPSISSPTVVHENAVDIKDASLLTSGTAGSLTAGQYDYGDNDSLGYSTIYVRLTDSTDPDTKSDGYIRSSTNAGDTDFPTTMVPGLVVLDGYTFVMDSNGTIYNSEQDDPTSWLAADFISAEIDADSGIAITKHLNYLVAFGEWTTEIFYNAGNATGSPLARIPSAIIRYGCAAKNSIVEGENFIAWVSHGREHGHNVMAMEGLQPVKISTKPIEKVLNEMGANVEEAIGQLLKTEGHYFYTLSFPTENITLVYDFVDKQWSEWTYDDGTEGYFEFIRSCEQGEELLTLHVSDGKVYKVDPAVYQDATNDINFKLRTNKVDFGNSANKFHHRLEIIGDRTTSSATMNIRWTDDDYQTWSSSKAVDLNKRATIHGLGRFQRRAFELTSTANAPIRIAVLELTGEVGTNVEGANA